MADHLSLLLECAGCGQREVVESDDTRDGKPIRDWFIDGGRRCVSCRQITVGPVKAMARTGGPDSAKLAAALAHPKVGTRKAKVLARLEFADGEWVPGEDIACAEVGGSEGLKRLRELRADGWPVEEKAPPGGEGMWWYRLPGRRTDGGGWEWSSEKGSFHRQDRR